MLTKGSILNYALSLSGAVLLLIAAGSAVFGYLGSGHISGLVPALLVPATCLILCSLAAMCFSELKLKGELDRGASVASQLARGALAEIPAGDGELLDQLRRISKYLEDKSRLATRVADAGLSAGDGGTISDADVLGRAMRQMLDSLRPQIKPAENEDTAGPLERLTRRIVELSSGDLSVEAAADDKPTREAAEALNVLIRSLRTLMSDFAQAASDARSFSNSSAETAQQLSRSSEAQASQISRAVSAVSALAREIQELSSNTVDSARIASESLGFASNGMTAAKDNISSVAMMRNKVQETAKRIKKVAERSQEISQMVRSIDELSDRTSLLALNASLRASSAGKANSDLAEMTDEMEKLAERSARLTQQISTLAQTLIGETREAVAVMEETIHDVVTGSAFADKTAQYLRETENASAKLAALLTSIAESARYQAKSSVDIHNALRSLAKVNDVVQIGSSRSADAAATLTKLSAQLQSSVAAFRLPNDMTIDQPSPASEAVTFIN